MRCELFAFTLWTSAAIDLGDESTGVRFGDGFVFQLLPGEVGCLAFETGVVAQNPALHGLGVPECMAGEPFDTELWVGTTGEIIEVEKGEDGAVGGTHHSDSLVVGAGDNRNEIAGFENNIEVQPLDVESAYGDGSSRRRSTSAENQAISDELDVIGGSWPLNLDGPIRGLLSLVYDLQSLQSTTDAFCVVSRGNHPPTLNYLAHLDNAVRETTQHIPRMLQMTRLILLKFGQRRKRIGGRSGADDCAKRLGCCRVCGKQRDLGVALVVSFCPLTSE